jgi:hypothetical protein
MKILFVVIATFLTVTVNATSPKTTDPKNTVPKTCQELYCGNAAKIGSAPCDQNGVKQVIKTIAFHELKSKDEKILVCAGTQEAMPPDIVALSVPPYNFQSGVKLVGVDEKDMSITVSNSPELRADVAEDLVKADAATVTLSLCSATDSFNSYCPDAKVSALIGNKGKVFAFAKMPEQTFLLSSKGVFVLDATEKQIAFRKFDGFSGKLLKSFGDLVILALQSSDGDTTSSEIMAYSTKEKSFTNLLDTMGLDIKVSFVTSTVVRIELNEFPEYEGPATSVSLPKSLKCLNGKLNAEATSASVVLDLKQFKKPRATNCN